MWDLKFKNFLCANLKFLKCIFKFHLESSFNLSVRPLESKTDYHAAQLGNFMVTRVSDTNHVRSTRVVRLDESLMKVAHCGIHHSLLSMHNERNGALRVPVQSSLDVISVFHREQIGLSCELFPDIVITASSIAPWRFECRGVLEGTRGRRKRLILFLDQGLL